jgi:tryptophan-rich sensory protein
LEHTTFASILSVVSIALSISLSYSALVIFKLGMNGVAWARTFAAVIGLALSLYVLTRYMPISFDKEALLKASLASAFLVIAVIALDLVRRELSPNSYQFLVIRLHLLPIYVAVGGLVYFLALIRLKAIKTQDVELIEQYLPSKLKPVASWLERFAVAS